jgi:hypothetical protein
MDRHGGMSLVANFLGENRGIFLEAFNLRVATIIDTRHRSLPDQGRAHTVIFIKRLLKKTRKLLRMRSERQRVEYRLSRSPNQGSISGRRQMMMAKYMIGRHESFHARDAYIR